MNPAYISALAALAGSIIGGLTSLATSWLAQRTQATAKELTRNRRRREKLYRTFIEEASRLYIDALGHDESQAFEQSAGLVKIYALVSRMRVLSSPRVIEAADNILRCAKKDVPGAARYVASRCPRRSTSRLQRSMPRRIRSAWLRI
jgi:hypothetical protein